MKEKIVNKSKCWHKHGKRIGNGLMFSVMKNKEPKHKSKIIPLDTSKGGWTAL
jgi:hypothetical protein